LTSGSSGKYNYNKIFGYLLPLIFTFIFLYLAFHNVNFADLIEKLSAVSLKWMLVFISFFLLSHLARAIRWKYIINSVKPDVSLLNSFGAVMIGYGINCAIPRLGEVYRSMFLGKWENISRSSLLGTVVVERVIDILSLAFAVLISVVIFPGNLYSKVDWLKPTVYAIFIVMSLAIVVLILTVRFKEKFYEIIIKIVSKFSPKIAKKLAGIFDTFAVGFASLKGKKNIFMTFFYTVVIMFIYGFNAYIGFYMLGMENILPVSVSMGWIVMTISAFGIVIPTPGGTGTYHFIAIAVLTGIFGFGEDISAAYAFLTHIIAYILFIVMMFVSFYVINNIRSKKGFPKETFLSVFKDREKSLSG